MEDVAPWLERAGRGDQAAYRELYRSFRPLVVRVVSGFYGLDRDEVEDVIQESFMRAFDALPRLRAPRAFPGWLLAIARNRARSLLEHKASADCVRGQLAGALEVEMGPIPPAFQIEQEVAAVRELISELPESPEKETVRLFYVEGQLSAREIAERLGVGKSAVTMRLERFRARVKRELLRRVLASRLE